MKEVDYKLGMTCLVTFELTGKWKERRKCYDIIKVNFKVGITYVVTFAFMKKGGRRGGGEMRKRNGSGREKKGEGKGEKGEESVIVVSRI